VTGRYRFRDRGSDEQEREKRSARGRKREKDRARPLDDDDDGGTRRSAAQVRPGAVAFVHTPFMKTGEWKRNRTDRRTVRPCHHRIFISAKPTETPLSLFSPFTPNSLTLLVKFVGTFVKINIYI